MRSRSIFCLFAPLNASRPVWFSETISRISTAAAAAFSVLGYHPGLSRRIIREWLPPLSVRTGAKDNARIGHRQKYPQAG